MNKKNLQHHINYLSKNFYLKKTYLKPYYAVWLKQMDNFLKKPMFLEVILSSLVISIVILISVSGSSKLQFTSDLAEVTDKKILKSDSASDYIDDELALNSERDSELEYYLNRDKENSASENYVKKTSSSKDFYNFYHPKATEEPSAPQAIEQKPDESPSDTGIDNNEEISEELPDVTVEPDATEQPEPEVVLDPNGPVMLSSIETTHNTESFAEGLKLTGYNSTGEKLSAEHIKVILNGNSIKERFSSYGSNFYYLNYNEGKNIMNVTIYDDNNASKRYSYEIMYTKPTEPTAVISIDAGTIGLGYLVMPVSVKVEDNKPLAYYIRNLLKENGFSIFSSGQQVKNYKIRGIYKYNLFSKTQPSINPDFEAFLLSNGYSKPDMNNFYSNTIKNGYFTSESMWVFNLNGNILKTGLSDYTLVDGDILELKYSLYDGLDLDYELNH